MRRKKSDGNLEIEPAEERKKPSSTPRTSGKKEADPSKRRADGLSGFYKFMIWFSFGLNMVLIGVLAVLGYQLFIVKGGLAPAKPLVGELDEVITGLQTATIKADVPLDTELPISLQVPVNQNTTVVIVEPVPLNGLPATINFPGGGGQLNAYVNLALPEGLALPVHLEMTIPLTDKVPVKLNVPVSIPLSETELAKPFNQLGELVQPLIELVDPDKKKPAPQPPR